MFGDMAQDAMQERILNSLTQELIDCKNKEIEFNTLSNSKEDSIENLESYKQGILFAMNVVKKSNW